MSHPQISIISGIYNCADTLPEAIESILAQTVTDWEWILCDDASSDGTYCVAQTYADLYPQKFILLRNEQNMGLNFTLNRCLAQANGKYIARMDGDDICSSQRFAEELRCLEEIRKLPSSAPTWNSSMKPESGAKSATRSFRRIRISWQAPPFAMPPAWCAKKHLMP